MLGRWTGLIVAGVVALAALTYGYYSSESLQIREERHEAIAAIGTLKADQVQLWRQTRLDHAEALSRAPSVRRDLIAHSGDPAANLDATRLVLTTGAETYGYTASYVLTGEGKPMLTVGRQPRAPSPDQLPTARDALAGSAAVMGAPFRADDGRVYVDTAAAVRDGRGVPLAVVVLRTDAQELLFPMLQAWPIPSRTAETILVRRDGDEVVFLNEMRHRPGSALTIREPITHTELATVQAVLGTTGITEGPDYRGVQVLADIRPVSDSDWYLVAKLDADEVWAEARYRAGVAVILIALLILGGAGGVAAFYRQRQAQQFRGLYESILENAELLREAEAVGELGSFVLDIPSDALRSSDNLDRVLGLGPNHPRTGAGWLEVVHPADRDEVTARYQQALAARGNFDCQYRIVHSSDKSERWVHSRARIDYGPDGAPLRMVGSIQDITSSRAAEHNRLSEEQRYQRQRSALIQLATSAPPKDEPSLNRAFQQLTEVASRTLDVERVSIWRYNPERTGIYCLDLYERGANCHSARAEIAAGDNPAYFQALTEADVLAADDAHRDPRTMEFAEGYLTPRGITSMMDAVIRLRGGVIGVLCCEHTLRVRRWTHDEQTFAVAMANLVALTLAGYEGQRAATLVPRAAPTQS